MVIEGRTIQKKVAVSAPDWSPVSRVSKIASLKRRDDKERARRILHEVATKVAPILNEADLRVGMLSEMYPKNQGLLGLNINKGQKILLRLRAPYDDKQFLPLESIISTMLHELVHNTHGKHDSAFYSLLGTYEKRYEELQSGKQDVSKYVCEEKALGSIRKPFEGYKSLRQKRLEAVTKVKFRSEARRLGGSSLSSGSTLSSTPKQGKSMRELMLEAAERRARDNKWCPNEFSSGGDHDLAPDVDLDISPVKEYHPKESSGVHLPEVKATNFKETKFIETVDLTDDSGDFTARSRDGEEIIYIDD